MNRWISTCADEGWIALYICILASVSPEKAFRILENPETAGRYRQWTEEDVKFIEKSRKAGIQWSEIGKKFSMGAKSVCSAYYQIKKRGRKNDNG